jgi:PleD family two-component response regulator
MHQSIQICARVFTHWPLLTVTIAADHPSGCAKSGAYMSTHPERPRASTLLIVDDDATQRSVISRIAQRLGYETTMAVSFDEAAGLIADRPFDCITVDLSLGNATASSCCV